MAQDAPSGAPVAAAVLAAGLGKRMRSSRPKVAFEVCGRPMVRHVLEAARSVGVERTVVVVGHGREDVEKALDGVPGVSFALQARQLGTGDAVRAALPALDGFEGTLLVLCGDVPLIRGETLAGLLREHHARGAACTVLTTVLPAGGGYGRIVREPAETGGLVAIREARDASPVELALREINTGLYAFDVAALREALPRVGNANAQGEYYLTDVPSILLRDGRTVAAVRCDAAEEVLGVNSLVELAQAAVVLRRRIVEDLMTSGVVVTDPATTYVDAGVTVGPGTKILPCTVIERDVTIGAGCEVGPFAHLRPGTVLADGAEVGNFVETKKARIGARTKAKHLTYLGDAEIGADVNVGCGTITANYDGRRKHVTTIEDGVHVGSGTVFVAPVTAGRGATTGAGAIVLRDVAPGATVVGVPARPLPGKGGGA
jgi:bifunctional UDP-N-acetylglucosamine pyrophosphorylase / glucosamine-1-phosphate N-acetyltransferase